MGLGLARPGGPQRPALMRKQTWVAARGEAARKQKQLSLGRGAQSSSMCVCVLGRYMCIWARAVKCPLSANCCSGSLIRIVSSSVL